jgi:hypothetical protein
MEHPLRDMPVAAFVTAGGSRKLHNLRPSRLAINQTTRRT